MIEISVCVGTACHLKGSFNIVQSLRHLLEEQALHDRVTIKSNFCARECQQGATGVVVSINGTPYSVLPEEVDEFFEEHVAGKLRK